MKVVVRAFWNPIVAKEYRSRMRTWRSPLAMTIYILLLGGLGWAIFSNLTRSSQGLVTNGGSPSYGSQIFLYLVIFQMALLAFITPALTAGAISGERERQTIDLLFVTRIPPFALIWGKLLASMSFVVLLLLLSVPIFSLVFLFGGVELDQMLEAFLLIGVTALTLGLIGIAMSTLFRRTLTATVTSYGIAFVLLAGSLIYSGLFPVTADPNATTAPAPQAVSLLSPVIPLIVIATNTPLSGYGVAYSSSSSCSFGPCNQGGVVCSSTGGTGQFGPPTSTFCGPPPVVSNTAITTGLFAGWQYWQANVVLQLAICVLALAFAAFWVPPVRRLPGRRKAAGAAATG